MDRRILGGYRVGHGAVRGDALDGYENWLRLSFDQRRKAIIAALRKLCTGNKAPTRAQWDRLRPSTLPGAQTAAFYIGGDNTWTTAMEVMGLEYDCRYKEPHPGPDVSVAYWEDDELPTGLAIIWYCDVKTRKEKKVLK